MCAAGMMNEDDEPAPRGYRTNPARRTIRTTGDDDDDDEDAGSGDDAPLLLAAAATRAPDPPGIELTDLPSRNGVDGTNDSDRSDGDGGNGSGALEAGTGAPSVFDGPFVRLATRCGPFNSDLVGSSCAHTDSGRERTGRRRRRHGRPARPGRFHLLLGHGRARRPDRLDDHDRRRHRCCHCTFAKRAAEAAGPRTRAGSGVRVRGREQGAGAGAGAGVRARTRGRGAGANKGRRA